VLNEVDRGERRTVKAPRYDRWREVKRKEKKRKERKDMGVDVRRDIQNPARILRSVNMKS
jgi:hypothetical protein